jgi:hypothetical protein
MSAEDKAIYRFFWDCGRQGNLHGVFVAYKDALEYAVGKELYFGEVLGKHSEVYGTFEASDLELVSDDVKDVEVFERLNLATGYNPLDYLPDDDESDDEDE